MKIATMAALPRMIDPYISDVCDRAPERFIDMAIEMNHLHDRIELRTAWTLLTRGEMDRAGSMGRIAQLVGPRIRAAVGIGDGPSLQARQIRMQRRQLIARGKEAAQRKMVRK